MAFPTDLSVRFGAPDPPIGTVLKSGSPEIAEALGFTPLDFLLVDRQHASPSLETVTALVRAAALRDLPAIVRLPQASLGVATNVLDAGASGVMLPRTEAVDAVERALGEVRYRAGRSHSSVTRAGGYGAREPDLAAVDDSLLLIPQIESERGLENAESIAGHEEVDAVAVGPNDLSISLGVDRGSEAFEAAVDRVFAAGEAAGCPVGTFVGAPGDLDGVRDRAGFVVCGSDVGLLRAVFESVGSEPTDGPP